MPVPFRIRCCRCGKNIPLAQDIYELDAEWQRRFPDTVGTLACHGCVLRRYWICTGRNGRTSTATVRPPPLQRFRRY
ncbi:hypothetical protein ACIOGT_38120 [Streptomyces microflavus]|uniref:hypothetical protein n=1 Tax=Streptomyces microflavus TaxID=1919 RepID=UPI003813B0DD